MDMYIIVMHFANRGVVDGFNEKKRKNRAARANQIN